MSGQNALSALTIWGRPVTCGYVEGIHRSFDQDIRTFEAGGFQSAFLGHEGADVEIGREHPIKRVKEDANVVVDATRVYQGSEVKNPYAYRFASSARVRRWASRGTPPRRIATHFVGHRCDVLVHEVQDNAMIDGILLNTQPALRTALQEHLVVSHSDVVDVPGVAKAAGAEKLVFCRHGPVPHGTRARFSPRREAAARAVGYTGTSSHQATWTP